MTATTPKAAIVAAARTAIGTARRGTLVDVDARELAKPVISAAIERSGFEPSDFEDLVLAEVLQGGGDIARYVAVELGLVNGAGMAVNRQCASSLTAIAVAAGQIAAGMNTSVLAGEPSPTRPLRWSASASPSPPVRSRPTTTIRGCRCRIPDTRRARCRHVDHRRAQLRRSVRGIANRSRRMGSA